MRNKTRSLHYSCPLYELICRLFRRVKRGAMKFARNFGTFGFEKSDKLQSFRVAGRHTLICLKKKDGLQYQTKVKCKVVQIDFSTFQASYTNAKFRYLTDLHSFR